MRLSVLSDSPFYDARRARNTVCFVDGVKVRYCVEASEEEGWALVNVRGANGRAVLEWVDGKRQIKRERITGRVELRPKADT